MRKVVILLVFCMAFTNNLNLYAYKTINENSIEAIIINGEIFESTLEPIIGDGFELLVPITIFEELGYEFVFWDMGKGKLGIKPKDYNSVLPKIVFSKNEDVLIINNDINDYNLEMKAKPISICNIIMYVPLSFIVQVTESLVIEDEEQYNILTKHVIENNGIYYGEINEKGIPDGFGVMYWIDGSLYSGFWKDGTFHGEGFFKANDFEYLTYEGEFNNGVPQKVEVTDYRLVYEISGVEEFEDYMQYSTIEYQSIKRKSELNNMSVLEAFHNNFYQGHYVNDSYTMKGTILDIEKVEFGEFEEDIFDLHEITFLPKGLEKEYYHYSNYCYKISIPGSSIYRNIYKIGDIVTVNVGIISVYEDYSIHDEITVGVYPIDVIFLNGVY